MTEGDPGSSSGGTRDFDRRPTLWQRQALKRLTKYARKHPDEPLTPDDWEFYWRFAAQPTTRAFKRVLRALPSTPRCGYCGAPFAGIGARIVRPLGYRPSRKNPNLCAACVELAPPGGTTLDVGVLFADLRGFTSRSEGITPAEATEVLRRFYGHAEKVFFPEALIDKLIGDEVMALYLPVLVVPGATAPDDETRRQVATVMLDHAHELLERVGYGSHGAPEVEVGIGLDFGEAFIGNIGNASVHDFTAIGDVVNTASRLQAQAAGGEVVVSARLAALLEHPPGQLEQLEIRGKHDPVPAYRARWFTTHD
jgi:adenylate cyclase